MKSQHPSPGSTVLQPLALAFLMIGLLAAPPARGQGCLNDAQGPDDFSGQKDLNKLCVGPACTGGFFVQWNFDDTRQTGMNTADSCVLFDTDGDDNADVAICVTLQDGSADGTTLPNIQTGDPMCFTCDDSSPVKCSNAVQFTCTSTCSVDVPVNSDPFAGQPGHDDNKCAGPNCTTRDAVITCCIQTSDLPSTAVLSDVCTYPSQSLSSAPSDCIITTGCVAGDLCDDSDPCTTDSCDTVAGLCRHVPGTPGAPCGSSSTTDCDNPDTCDVNGLCQPNNVPDDTPCTTDGNVCTNDVCTAGVCTHPNNTIPCNDNNACTTNDTCAGGACVGGTPPNCDDGNVCTDDSCNPASGCVHTNNSAPCNDDNACTTGDICSGGTCVGTGPNCDDGNVCTTDGCSPATGCTHTNNTNPCDDGDACTTNDTCSAGTCVGGAPPNCDDGNVCTTDGCNPATGCTHTNNSNPCNDGNACTTNDTCSAGSCVGGPALNCNDGMGCTADSCNPARGCVNTAQNSACNDSNACTVDVCNPGASGANTTTGCLNTFDPSTGCAVTLTNSSLCTFDVDSSMAGSQFRLIYTPDPSSPSAYKLNASNPGQFYYNTFYVGPGSTTLTITLPYPFVTQGAVPIHVYSGVQSMISMGGQTCFVPGTELANSSTQVTLMSYSQQVFGSTTTITVNLPSLPSNFAYVNIHLDYGLKGTAGYSKGAQNQAMGATTTINDKVSYIFSDSLGGSATVQNENVFKRDPGIAGLVRNANTDPVPNVQVKIYDSSNKLQTTVYTDQDGWYMWQYKYTGKAATFTIKLPAYNNLAQSVTLKSNAFVVVNFSVP